MAVYPCFFGHVELAESRSVRGGRLREKEIGVRLVRPADPHTDARNRTGEGRS